MRKIGVIIILIAAAVAFAGCKKDKVEPEKTYTVTVTVTTEGGTAKAEPTRAAEGATVTLTAKANEGYDFEKWTVISGKPTLEDPTANSTTFTMPAGDVEIEALFVNTAAQLFSVKVISDGHGTVTAEPSEAAAGTTITITAEPDKNYEFDKWTVVSGNLTLYNPTLNPHGFAMPAGDVEIGAEFTEVDVFQYLEDENLLEFCQRFDTDRNGKLSLDEAATVRGLDINNMGIASLAGIEYFTSLESLYCPDNLCQTVDLRANTALTHLNLSGNRLEELDVSANTALIELNCYQNQLAELDVTSNKVLTSLNCSDNLLTELDVTSNKALTSLNCSDNLLTELDISKNTELTSLVCFQNQLKELNVRPQTVLINLYCDNNSLTKLDVGANTVLVALNCSGNLLTECNVSKNPNLIRLECSYNKLTELYLDNLTDLQYLSCSDNHMDKLVASGMVLDDDGTYYLYCGRQTEPSGASRDLLLTLPQSLWPIWKSRLASLDENRNVYLDE